MAIRQHASGKEFRISRHPGWTQIKGGAENAQNLSTQKASEKERARLQKENGYCRRQKRSEEKKSERQKETDLLIKSVYFT